MKFSNIFWGIILILFGLLFTLQNLHVVDFDWYNLWRLWPVIFILWGISILPARDFIKVVLVLAVLGGSVYYMFDNTVEWRMADRDFTEMSSDAINQQFEVPFEDSISTASLYMEMAAGKFNLMGNGDQLVDFNKSGSLIDYKYSVRQEDNDTRVRIMMEDGIRYKHNKGNRIDLNLNNMPVWDLSFEVGAADVDMDLTPLQVSKLRIEGGAAAFHLRLGNLSPMTHVKIEAGASSIELKIPEDAGCELKINTVLSGRTIQGFDKVDHGLYRTQGFDDATSQIYIEVDAAVSSYSITRY